MTDSAAPRSPPAAGRAGIASAQCACYYPGQFISGRQPTLPTLPTKAARRERHQQLAPCALVAANVADCGIRGPLMLVFSNLLVNLAARPACLDAARSLTSACSPPRQWSADKHTISDGCACDAHERRTARVRRARPDGQVHCHGRQRSQ